MLCKANGFDSHCYKEFKIYVEYFEDVQIQWPKESIIKQQYENMTKDKSPVSTKAHMVNNTDKPT